MLPTAKKQATDVAASDGRVTGPVVASCTLLSTGGANTYTNQTCPFTETVSGSRRIYVTFRQAQGGPAGNFGQLNWVQFSGAGVGF